MFFNNKFNTFFGLNLTLVYTFPMCMTWRFHFPLRNYDFKLTSYKTRKAIFSNKRKLKGSHYVVTENLTKRRAELLRKARTFDGHSGNKRTTVEISVLILSCVILGLNPVLPVLIYFILLISRFVTLYGFYQIKYIHTSLRRGQSTVESCVC